MSTPASTDVVVVGAGFAGLSAARALVRLGHDVVVLEGRDRVGGRSSTATIAGVPVDLGATFVGPTQDAVAELAAELGSAAVPTFSRGKNLIRWRGRVRSYRSTIPRLSIIELLDVSRIQWRFERVCRRVSVEAPWTGSQADSLDSLSLDGWLKSVHASAGTRDLMAIMSRVTWGCEPAQVSMLHAVRYVKAAGGLDRMLDVEGGAQQSRFAAGTQQIAIRIADELTALGHDVILNAVVRSIERHSDGTLTVTSDHGAVRAKAVIVAIPPEHRKSIAFVPELSPEYGKLAQHWPQGNLSKAYAAYETPFWRAKGLSGEALSDEGPVFITFDVSPDDSDEFPARGGGPGVLLGFVDARSFDALPPAQRRERALSGFATLFGEAARQPIDYLDHCWGAEQFAPGGPTAAVPPGSWTTYGPWLRKPVDGIYWAGTETADTWTGFLDGAVRSGRRAADEVHRALAD
ncbi:monooxygenase [Mycolicibacterium sp. GF69]|uniref:flavin monoamine oxidase family protein n=1 Tax=Mycolicibacterium sp. GF69 TaxID=2267251 RepID=UPI000DCD8852|nr:flavin monoamine oxidase family protein [Mycolicibacterium sp. GF69]RAV09552.1 monooxygenase [Mycolicibacterium sp. GF69]